MHQETFQQQLEREIGKTLKLRINDNRSTMLSVKWEPNCTRVSIHKFFLEAPQNVMDALACYIRRDDKKMAPEVKLFIEENVKKLDYSYRLDTNKLEMQGRIYNLTEMMKEINYRYFENKLDLNITWFGNPRKRNRSRITFGLYNDALRLVKINRLLDNPKFPDYIVSYVIYHEMLHHVCPAYIDEKGRNRIHTKEFHRRETQFHNFGLAQKWIKENINNFFAKID